MAARPRVTGFNHPAGLIHLLDKTLQAALTEHGIPTPPLVAEDVKVFAQPPPSWRSDRQRVH